MNGIYCAYLTGQAGNSMLLFLLKDEMFAGADVGGMKYDGTFKPGAGDSIEVTVVYEISPGAQTLITGATPPPPGTKIPFQFSLPKNFSDGHVITLQTPLGPVNASVKKIRDL